VKILAVAIAMPAFFAFKFQVFFAFELAVLTIRARGRQRYKA